ncbi:unnamed protein product [Parajaminaea phylloscopi]
MAGKKDAPAAGSPAARSRSQAHAASSPAKVEGLASAVKGMADPKATPARKASTSKAKALTTSTNPTGKVRRKKASGDHHDLGEMTSEPIVQGSVSPLPIVFTKDADYFFTAAGCAVKIFSRVTGEVVSTLAPPTRVSGEEENAALPCRSTLASLSGILIHPTNPLQLLTASLDGTIRVWDFLDAILLRTIDVGFPVTHLASHPSLPDHVFVSARKPKTTQSGKKPDPFDFTGRSNSIIYSVSLALSPNTVVAASESHAQGTYGRPKEFLRIGKTREAAGLQVSPDGKWLVAIGNRKVQIARTAALRDGFTKLVSDERLVSLAFHPTEPSFATGDAVGKIRVWHCLSESYLDSAQTASAETQAPSSLLHWHAHAVASLAYTPNGAYLVSGGEEAVLVLWQLSTGQREYVPRLGAPIASISIADGLDGREQEFALGLADGSVTFVGAVNLKPTRTFVRTKVDPSRQLLGFARLATLPSPLAIEPVTGQAVLPSSHPSSLQFVDLEADRIAYELEVAPSNRVSRPDETPLEPTRVERVAFSSRPTAAGSGPAEWMATVDSRSGGGTLSSDLALKFWRWSGAESRYVLNTRIDKPHEGGAAISSMGFSPLGPSSNSSELLFATASRADRKVKIWRIASHQARGGRLETYWVPRSIFGYRDTRPEAVRWSPDGSLLAVAQGPFVTVWEPVSNALIAALSCPELKTATHLEFLGRAGRYVAVASARSLVVWDLVSSTVRWHQSYDEPVQAIVPTNGGSALTVISHFVAPGIQRRRRAVLDVRDTVSGVTISRKSLPFAIRAVAAASRQTKASIQGEPSFVAMDEGFGVHNVGESASMPMAGPSRAGESAQSLRSMTIKRRTLFDDLFGSEDQFVSGPGAENAETPVAGSSRSNARDVSALFDAPAHLLPPIQMLFDSYVASIMPPPLKEAAPSREGADGDGSIQIDLDEDEQPETNTEQDSAPRVRSTTVQTKAQDEEEMRAFTSMFSKQLSTRHAQGSKPAASKKPPSTAPSSGLTNGTGTPKSNGKDVKMNGTEGRAGAAKGSPSPAKGAKKQDSAQNSPVAANAKKSDRVGKKRKSLS